MDQRQIARTIAVGRIALGAAGLLAPGLVARSAFGIPGSRHDVKIIVRSAAVRDLVLGLGAVRSLGEGGDAAAWVRAGAVCDAGDLVAAVAASRGLPRLRALGIVAGAAAGAVGGWRAASRLG
jgi:hypothetical protein